MRVEVINTKYKKNDWMIGKKVTLVKGPIKNNYGDTVYHTRDGFAIRISDLKFNNNIRPFIRR